LGGNDFQRSAREDYVSDVTELWSFVNEQMNLIHENDEIRWRVVWISPASVTGRASTIQSGRNRAAAAILSVTTHRNYIESRDITRDLERTPDGLHFTPTGGRRWAHRVLPRLESRLRR
jgi:lysophospholipase L1-like esterase